MAENFNSFNEAFTYWRNKRIAENVSDIFKWNGRDYHSYTSNELKQNTERTSQIADEFNWSQNLRDKYGIDTTEIKEDPKRSEKVELQKKINANHPVTNDILQIQQNISQQEKMNRLRQSIFGDTQVTSVTPKVTDVTPQQTNRKGFLQSLIDEGKMAVNGMLVDAVNTPASLMNEGGKAISQLLGVENPKDMFGYVPKLQVNDKHQGVKELAYNLLPALMTGGESLLNNTERGQKLSELLSTLKTKVTGKAPELSDIVRGIDRKEIERMNWLNSLSDEEFLGFNPNAKTKVTKVTPPAKTPKLTPEQIKLFDKNTDTPTAQDLENAPKIKWGK